MSMRGSKNRKQVGEIAQEFAELAISSADAACEFLGKGDWLAR